MRRIPVLFHFLAIAIAGLTMSLATFDASAHGPRGRIGVGVHVGVPGPFYWGGPRYYYGGTSYYYSPPPYYYYGAPAIVEQAPVYVERGSSEPAAQPASPGDWYFCTDPEGYYPYVKQCPGGWRKVPAQPPANPQ